jgi:hypothetical protein
VGSVVIINTLKFDKNDSCEMGLRHPIYTLLDEVKKLKANEGIKVLVNDYDWLLVIKNTLLLIGDIKYEDHGDVDSFHELVIYRVTNPQQ